MAAPPKPVKRGAQRDLFSRERMRFTRLHRMAEDALHERDERDEERSEASRKRTELRQRAQEEIDREDN